MDDIELHHPRDSTFTIVRHAVMTSPRTIRLVTHLLVVATNFLTAFALAIVVVAFGATFIIQCFSVICVIEKFIDCFNEVAISMGARIVSFLLMKSCFSRGASDGSRDRLAAGRAIVKISIGCCWSSIAYSVPTDKLHAFYFSWSFFTIVICQVWLQLIIVRVEEMFRREQGGISRESRKDRMTCSVLILLPLGLLCWLISMKLSKDFSLESIIMLRNAMNSLYEGAVVETLIISLMGNESSSSAYAYEDSSTPSSSQHRKLSHEVGRLVLQLILDSAIMISSDESNRAFICVLLATDTIALSDPLLKMLDIAIHERHLRRKFPKLSAAEFANVPKEETCPVCLECHTLRETVRLPCHHLVHSSCVLSMARVAAANSRRYRAGLQYPLSTSAHRCPICRASLSFDSSPAIASDGENESPMASAPLSSIPRISAVGSNSTTNNNSSLRVVPSPSVSLGSEMIRSTFGGRVLVALTNRQPLNPAPGNVGESSFYTDDNRGSSSSFTVQTQVPLLSTIRLASLSPIGVLERQNGFRVGPRNPLAENRSSDEDALANESTRRVGGVLATALVSGPPATAEHSTARDVHSNMALDYWYPANMSTGIPSNLIAHSLLSAASSSSAALQLEVVGAVPVLADVSSTGTSVSHEDTMASLASLNSSSISRNMKRKRKREIKPLAVTRSGPDNVTSDPVPRLTRARTKENADR